MQLDELPQAVASLAGASGRMQRIDSAQGGFIVDYAHTPDALTQVLASLRAHCVGKLWAVVGCGGERDAGKSPLLSPVFFFKQKTAYEILRCLVGSEMCIRDRCAA